MLVLAMEPWRSDDSGGNTLNNFFEGMNGVEFAHIFCGNRMPKNKVCRKYFHIPQKQLFISFFTRQAVGKEIDYSDNTISSTTQTTTKNINNIHNGLANQIKRLRPSSVIFLRNILLRYGNWANESLDNFIMNFKPDVIYAPCYASPFQLAINRYVKKLTGKKIITWSADDCYSLRQFSVDPFFWINRIWIRHCLRKTYPYYDEFYSISEEEAEEMGPIVGKKIGILRKGVVVPESFTPRGVHKPIKFIYAGGLYLNRHKSLIKLADAISKLNREEIRAELHIYSGSQLDKNSTSILNDGRSSFIHGLISPDELSRIYQESDVAIHCESFDLKYRLRTRLSFSTKIIDCFQSGCAILAVAWKDHAGIKCLQREDAAICVTDVKDIGQAVNNLVEHPEKIKEYAVKAYECEKRNHRIEDVHKKLYDAFVRNS